ncbi:sensor histidine kinase [Olleya sp. Hel_I_94]|uniref:tetratricopeptide repeat-containing sensor histidine kinase n=1 Tax=Olleya sp. Hel_I_94 TaxID=1250001 RepID=UPI0011ACE63B|nr:sensor histidine kinase [Olleya sp. Hel_I_94]TVZ49585.1 two-component sensor histidine kinase [Olleya sp. Hel_I_94]
MKYLFLCISIFFFQISFTQTDSVLIYGQNLIDQNKLDTAIIYYKKHLLSPSSQKQQVHLLFGLADAYKLKLDYTNANENYSKSFITISKIKDKQLEFLYYVKKAEFFRKRAMHLDAVKELDKALVILKNTPINDLYLSKYYNRKAALFTEHYQLNDSTLYYSNKSLVLAKKTNDNDAVFYSLLEISGVYERKKDYKTSLKYLDEIIAFAKSNNMKQQEADAYISYVMVLARSNQLEKALKASLYAADFSKKNKFLYNEIIFNQNIQNLYFRLNNIEKAYEYLKQRLELTTKYDEIKKEELLFNLETQYKLADKESQIKINNLEIINQKKALASNKVNLYIALVLFMFSIAVAVLIAYFLKRSKKSNKQLQKLSSENEFLLSEANHRINNNLQLVVILITNQLKKASETEKIQLKNILIKVEAISTLHKHLYKNEDKQTIDIANYLKDVKTSFFDVFKENDITTNFDVNSLEIATDQAMYFGLLLTELLINSIKHAFKEQDYKVIDFTLRVNNGLLLFIYSDNGISLANKSIKPKLVDKICRQLEMDYNINSDNGFNFSMSKKINNE